MAKDYVGERTGKVLTPDDPGFNDPSTPWGGIRNAVGWKKPDAVKLHIAGFFLIDRRMKPHIAIFKNVVLVGKERPKSGEDPTPFESLAEALHHKDKMHLSSGDESMVKPVAIVGDPGFGNAKPDRMWVDKNEAKRM